MAQVAQHQRIAQAAVISAAPDHREIRLGQRVVVLRGLSSSVDAPLQARETLGSCCAWSDAVICPAIDAAGRQPPACMGRGPGPDHP
jgi:hypothetical protein